MALKYPNWKMIEYITEDIAASTIVSLNTNEMLCVSHNTADNYKFNMDDANPSWKLYSTRHGMNGWCEHSHLIGVFNRKQQKVYLYGGTTDMHIFDPKSKEWNTIPDITVKQDALIEHFMFTVDDTIHLIGGDYNNSHQIWNYKTQTFELVHEFTEYQFIRYTFCVYIPQKSIILLLGGLTAWDIPNDRLQYMDCIWKYCIKSAKWSVIPNITLNLWNACAIVTDDGKHVIITGCNHDNHSYRDIFILDIFEHDRFALHKCDIHCPKDAHHVLMKTGSIKDELLVFGYVRRLLTLPMEILNVMTQFYSITMVHWIQYELRHGYFPDSNVPNRYAHYMIPLKHLLLSTQ